MFAQRFIGGFHDVDGRHDVFQVVGHHGGLFHVPGLLLHLVALAFVHLPSLQDLEGFLFQGGFAGAVAHLGHALLVGGQFGIQFGEFDVEGFDVGVCLLGC